jgi:hypothetical protein
MGDHFKTDTDQLGKFVTSLQRSLMDLREARDDLSHVCAGQIGTARLDEACDTFQQRWKYGSEQMSEQIGAISDGVKENKLSYQKLENELTQALAKMQGAVASSGGGGR